MMAWSHMVVSVVLTASPALPAGSVTELGRCPGRASTEAEAILDDLNTVRRERELPPLRFHPALCEVAGRQAEAVRRRGGIDAEVESVGDVSQALFREGYAHHQWQVATIHFPGPAEELVETWRQHRPEDFESLVLGDFRHLGVGVAELEGVPVYALLATLPRSVYFERESAGLRDLERVRERVVSAVNRRRETRGLTPLEADPRLHRAAQQHAEAMLREGFYSHVGADGSTVRERLAVAGYEARRAAENIARGLFTAEEVVERWMNSPSHRRNILDARFRHVGVGLAFGPTADGLGEVDWVQVFGTPVSSRSPHRTP